MKQTKEDLQRLLATGEPLQFRPLSSLYEGGWKDCTSDQFNLENYQYRVTGDTREINPTVDDVIHEIRQHVSFVQKFLEELGTNPHPRGARWRLDQIHQLLNKIV